MIPVHHRADVLIVGGGTAAVEAAVAAAQEILGHESGMLLRTEVIPRPHPQLIRWLL